MKKLDYLVVAKLVEEMYNYPDDMFGSIDEHIKLIAEFIKSAGWTEEEYFKKYTLDQLNEIFFN